LGILGYPVVVQNLIN